MIFSLEAVNAKQGDCLLLHWGEAKSLRHALIDGGPGGVYEQWLKPRLASIARPGQPPELELVLVSHIDDDHIHGVLDLFGASVEAMEDELPAPFVAERLWHNAFHELAGPSLNDASVEADVDALTGKDVHAGAFVASVGQGERLRADADGLSVPINDGQGGLIARGATSDLRGGLKLSVIAPSTQQLDALREKWEKEVAKHGKAAALATAYVDTSVENRSSIVVLAEAGGRRMLLTGDARGDEVVAGLGAAGLLDDRGVLRVELLKVPHHGSSRNVERSFFESIQADHYVISADGKYGNPEDETLQMVLDSRSDDAFTLHLTNHEGVDGLGDRLDAFLARARKQGRQFGLVYRDPGQASLGVDLGDPAP